MPNLKPKDDFSPLRHFNSATLYEGNQNNDLPYLLGFSAFIFMLVSGALLTLLLWEQAGIQSGFNYNEFYILLLPTQAFLGIGLLFILWISALMVKTACSLMLEKNRETLELLKLMGAQDEYIMNSFHRSIFKRCMSGISIGTSIGTALLLGFRFYLLFRFAEINSLMPKINAIDFWFFMLWLVTISVYGIILMFYNGQMVRKFLNTK